MLFLPKPSPSLNENRIRPKCFEISTHDGPLGSMKNKTPKYDKNPENDFAGVNDIRVVATVAMGGSRGRPMVAWTVLSHAAAAVVETSEV